jgi:hypothetical protein
MVMPKVEINVNNCKTFIRQLTPLALYRMRDVAACFSALFFGQGELFTFFK